MARPTQTIVLIAAVAVSFLAGTWYSQRKAVAVSPPGGRRILYYHDPMHPAYKSDKPGIAPDCGMQLEPVYADEAPGGIQISSAKQQLIGIRLGKVERLSVAANIRTSGRVAVDETRVYRLLASTEGWTRETFPNSTGSLVKKDEALATFYSREFLTAQQAFFYALNVQEKVKKDPSEPETQLTLTNAQVRSARETLESLGMSANQIEEIAKTRQPARDVVLRAPATSFILSRNVTPNQRFEKGQEFFKLGDLSRVWILADVFQSEAKYLPPGSAARVSLPQQGHVLQARVSDVLPQFDPASKTLKLRLEADNPDYALRPDMLADVEFPVRLPPDIAVPSEAILDSGLNRTVFVDRGNGHFEPRQVRAGWRFGGNTQILEGLAAGEIIVLSGNFLVDSESRLMSRATMQAAAVKDPVCGMPLDPAKPGVRKSDYKGTTYYFCMDACKRKFDHNPAAYLKTPAR